MKKEIPELSKLELNQKNVMELLFKCKATPQSKEIVTSAIYSKDSSRKAPKLSFDNTILNTHYHLIRYWLGQLQAIHQEKKTMPLSNGLINYQNKPWTNNEKALLALYYLATAADELPPFIDGEKHAEATDLDAYYALGLKKTYSPNDPKFNIRDAKKALADLGVSLDGQSHVD